MAELVGVLQMMMQNTIKAMKLTDAAMGTVESASPLSVRTDAAAQAIPERALLLTDSVRERTETVQGGAGGCVVVHSGLKAGDRVLMLRVSKGNQYIILSKIT